MAGARTNINLGSFLNEMIAQNIGMVAHILNNPENPYYQRPVGWKLQDYANLIRIRRKTVSLPITGEADR